MQRRAELRLDEESRTLATSRQRARHLARLKERDLPGWMDGVDHAAFVLAVTIFDSGYPEILGRFKSGAGVSLAVGEDTLKTYEPDGGQAASSGSARPASPSGCGPPRKDS